jgi:mannosyl-3-phosphoglycerate phosphatase
MLVVFTDLDGTLLEHDNYSFEAAKPSLAHLRRLQARVVLLSSKTLQEVLFWRTKIINSDPFAVENGGAIFASGGNPPLQGNVIQTAHGYEMVEFGVPYGQLIQALKDAARESRCFIRGFGDMTINEIAHCCEIDLDQARMAKDRSYDEPFQLLQGNLKNLRATIEKRGLRLKHGSRFLHITGRNDKADAARLLIEAYTSLDRVQSIGIGDALNDVGFLNLVDCPVILDSPFSAEVLKRVPAGQIFPAGPAGWNKAILGLANSSLRHTQKLQP